MPNGHDPNKKYGSHKYADHGGTSDCEYGCGCSMGNYSSDGPPGLDPGGTCPKNPIDGHLLGGNEDYRYVVQQRIEQLSSRAYQAETELKSVEPSKKRLAADLLKARQKLAECQNRLKGISKLARG